MQQHPVPQNIASYEFRLVGDMTLKQFFQVAGGALVALLFYASPLPGFIKWPIIFLFSGLGVAFAFLPIEDRPLSMWFVAFLRAIYSPTKFAWQKGAAFDTFAPETGPVSVMQIAATPGGEQAAEIYLATPATSEEPAVSSLEEKERSFFQKMLSLFPTVKSPFDSAQGLRPTSAPQSVQPVQEVEPVQAAQTSAIEPSLQTQYAPPSPPITPNPQPPTQIPVWLNQKVTTVPYNAPVQVAPPPPQNPPSMFTSATPMPFSPLSPVFRPEVMPRRGPGRPRLNAPRLEISSVPPPAPAAPNIIVGQVIDPQDKVIEAAIIEIKDSEGRPVRALRTNKVGHFLTATPLMPGQYEIMVEKEGLIFDPIQVEISNQIVQPLAIKARAN
ncbi:PrgI family protein [Candidatus Microgenomates bacterium]|nr:PrgI family protein [Candidatus Microgenomates bacterium]